MPIYTYRRDDGTTFDYRQKFGDDALTVDPVTGQHVVRVIQAAGVIFKGSGFYINDSKSASRSTMSSPPKTDKAEAGGDAPAKTETKSEAKPASTEASAPAAAAD